MISKKNAGLISVLPGVLLADVFLTSSGIVDNPTFRLLPENISNFCLIVITMGGCVLFLQKLLILLTGLKD